MKYCRKLVLITVMIRFCVTIDSTASSLNCVQFDSPICISNFLFIRISITFQTLKHPGSLSSKDRKKLADMAVACYTEQVRKNIPGPMTLGNK